MDIIYLYEIQEQEICWPWCNLKNRHWQHEYTITTLQIYILTSRKLLFSLKMRTAVHYCTGFLFFLLRFIKCWKLCIRHKKALTLTFSLLITAVSCRIFHIHYSLYTVLWFNSPSVMLLIYITSQLLKELPLRLYLCILARLLTLFYSRTLYWIFIFGDEKSFTMLHWEWLLGHRQEDRGEMKWGGTK